jgi:hypothetical protein
MIKVKNISNYTIYVIAADYNFHRKLNPGREISVTQEVYDELTFDLGFEKLVRGGALKVTGVNAEVSEVIEVPYETLTPAEIKKIFEEKDYAKFTKAIQKASPATKESIIAVAVDNRISDNAFISLIKKYCGVNVIEAISVQVQAEEN